MATSSTSTVLKIPVTYPYNQTFPAAQDDVFTDTETEPSTSTTYRSVEAPRFVVNRQNLIKKRNIAVQTKVFRTDQDAGAVSFTSCYTTVTEDVL